MILSMEKVARCALAAMLAVVVAACGFVSMRAYADDTATGDAGGELTVPDTDLDPDDDAAAAAAAEEALRQAKLARKTIKDGLYNISSTSKSTLSLAVKGGSTKNGANVVSAKRATASWPQKWAVAWDEDTGYYKIRNLKSRMYLSVSGKVKAGAGVKQVKSAKSSAQLWEVVKKSGKVMLKPAGSNLALSTIVEGSSVSFKLRKAQSASSAKAAQKFKLRRVDALETNLTYYVRNVGSGKRLHVSGNSIGSGAKLDLAASKGVKSQKFRLLKSGSSYRLQNVGSCYYAGTNAKGSGFARQLATKSGKRSAWKVKLDPKAAAFTIASSKSGKRLNGKSSKLTLKKASGKSAQLFTFTRTYAFKVYLNPGHGWNSGGNSVWDSGAVGSGHQEAEFTHDLAKRVVSRLDGTDVKVINGERYGLAFWKRLPKAVSLGCDAIVSLHFDAGGGSGTLKMVGVQGRAPGSMALANAVHSGVVSSLRLPDRGVSYRSDITCVNGSIPSMLTEVCYMDNAGDVQTYLNRRNTVAAGIASGIVKASRTRAVVNGRA